MFFILCSLFLGSIPSTIIHHHIQVIISSSIIRSSSLLGGCGLQYLHFQHLLTLLTLKGGVIDRVYALLHHMIVKPPTVINSCFVFPACVSRPTDAQLPEEVRRVLQEALERLPTARPNPTRLRSRNPGIPREKGLDHDPVTNKNTWNVSL